MKKKNNSATDSDRIGKPGKARGPVQRDAKEVMAELVVKLSQKLEPQAARTGEEKGRQQGMPGPNRDRLTVGVDLGDKWSNYCIVCLDEEKLTALYSPALTGAKLNLGNFTKLQKSRQLVPFGTDLKMNSLPLFLSVLLEELSTKDRAAVIKNAMLDKSEVAAYQKLEGAAKKLERDLKADKLKKASQLYQTLIKAPGEQVLWLMVYSAQRLVQDRIKNYFEKYLPASQEVTDEMVTLAGAVPGTPKFQKTKDEMILKHLDARPKKVEPPPEPPPPPPMSSFARGPGVRHAR